MEQPLGIEALKAAVELLKSQTALARAIGKPQSYVSELLAAPDKKVPAEWCLPIERATGGVIKRQHLRPDLYPEERVLPPLNEERVAVP